MKRFLLLCACIVIATSCRNEKTVRKNGYSPDSLVNTVKVKYTPAMVDNKMDLACGMPLTAGIKDTCHYKGKVYGFCSTECKEAFLKNPAIAIKEK